MLDQMRIFPADIAPVVSVLCVEPRCRRPGLENVLRRRFITLLPAPIFQEPPPAARIASARWGPTSKLLQNHSVRLGIFLSERTAAGLQAMLQFPLFPLVRISVHRTFDLIAAEFLISFVSLRCHSTSSLIKELQQAVQPDMRGISRRQSTDHRESEDERVGNRGRQALPANLRARVAQRREDGRDR